MTGKKKLTAARINRGKCLPPRLIAIGKEIEAKASKADTYHAKAGDMVASIKQLLVEAEGYCNKSGYNAFRKRFCPSLSKSRAYQLLAIASGKTTVDKVRAEGAARQAKHIAKLRAAATALSSSVTETRTPEKDVLRQFNTRLLELVLSTKYAKPAEFARTTIDVDDLEALGSFLMAVARLKEPAGMNADRRKEEMAA
jgi:hypothetical protein